MKPLFSAAFKKNVSLEFLLRKYNTKFAGAEFIGHLAFTPDHSPAAFYGVLPCYFRINGQTILSAQSGDTMTHPLHRREGLFIRLAQETYALAKQKQIEFIFGFPNKNSYPGLVKMGWKFPNPQMKLFRLKANPIPFSKIINKVCFIRDIYYDLLRRKFQVGKLHEWHIDHSHDGVVRDTNFLDYKTYCETFFIQIDETPVWIKLDSAIKVGYVEVSRIQSLENFLNKLTKVGFQAGCNEIIFLTTTNTSLYRMLSGVVAAEDSFPVGFYELTDRKWDFSNVQFEYCDIDIF